MASGEGAGSLSASESAATTATRTARGRRVWRKEERVEAQGEEKSGVGEKACSGKQSNCTVHHPHRRFQIIKN